MARLHIPPLGAKLTLAQDWTFDLFGEYRNDGLFRALKIAKPTDPSGFYADHLSKPVTLPVGSELIVRRYYIRQGNAAFDSVTFSVKVGKKSTRFWAKLGDVNRIQLVEEGVNG